MVISSNLTNGQPVNKPRHGHGVLVHCRYQSTTPHPEDVEKLNQLLGNPITSPISPELKEQAASNFISDSPICHAFADLITGFHDLCGLEWWSTIVIAGILFRVSVCVPIKVYQEHVQAKVMMCQPIINEKLLELTPRLLGRAQNVKAV